MYALFRSFVLRSCTCLCLIVMLVPSFAVAGGGGGGEGEGEGSGSSGESSGSGSSGSSGGSSGFGGGEGGSHSGNASGYGGSGSSGSSGGSGYGGGGSGYGGGEGGSHSGNASGYGGSGSSGSSGGGLGGGGYSSGYGAGNYSYSGSGAGAGSSGGNGSASGWGGGGEGGNSTPESYGGSTDGGSGGGLGGSYSSGYGAGDYSYSEAVDAANGGIDFSSSLGGNVGRGGAPDLSISFEGGSAMDAVLGALSDMAATVPAQSTETFSITPTAAQSIAQNFNSNVNIGTAPAPGPTNEFTGSVNPDNAEIDFVDTVVFTGDLGRGPGSFTFGDQTASVRSATFADFAALAGLDPTQTDIETLGQLLAGELPGSTVSAIARGDTLTSAQMQEVGMIMSSVASRFGSDVGGPARGDLSSLADTATAGNTSQNAGQYSAFNDNSIGRTISNYNQNPEAFQEMASNYFNGTIAQEYGLGVAVPTVNGQPASHYYNEDVSNPDWGAGMQNVANYASGHRSGTLTNEFAALSGGRRDAQQGSYLSGAFSTITSIDGRGIEANPNFAEDAVSFAITGAGNALSLGDPATNNDSTETNVDSTETTATAGNTWSGIDVTAFVDSLPALSFSENSFLGGVPLGGSLAAPVSTTETTVAITPALEAAFQEVGINDRSAMESIMNDIDYAASVPGIGANQNTAANSLEAVLSMVDPENLAAIPSVQQEIAAAGAGLHPNISIKAGIYDDELDGVLPGMVVALNDLAERCDCSIVVTSGRRDPHTNQINAGATRSKHLTGYAIDVRDPGRLGVDRDTFIEHAQEVGFNVLTDPYEHTDQHVHLSLTPEEERGFASRTEETIGTSYAALSESTQSLLAEIDAAIQSQQPQTPANPAAPVTPEDPNTAVDDAVEEAPQTETETTRTGIVTRAGNVAQRTVGRTVDQVRSILGGIADMFGFNFGGGTPPDADGEGESSTSTPFSLNTMPQTALAIASAQTHENGEERGFWQTIYEWLFGKQEVQEVFTELSIVPTAEAASRPYQPVFVQIDEVTGAVRMVPGALQNIQNTQLEESAFEREERVPDDISLLFADDGSILYSDGTFAPPRIRGAEMDTGIDYVYFIQRYRNGELVGTETNKNSLPGNFFTRAFANIFADRSPFDESDVAKVTYVTVDANGAAEGGEYREYTIKLHDGSSRAVVLPITTSLAFMLEEFAQVGYRGDPLALAKAGVEVARQEVVGQNGNAITRALEGISSLISGDGGDSGDVYTDLATDTVPVGEQFTSAEVTSLAVHMNVPMECPEVGTVFGYVYEVTIRGALANGVQGEQSGYAARCGSGGSRTYAVEIAKHLESEIGVTAVDPDHLLAIMEIDFDTPDYLVEATEVPEIIPNETNQVTFEAKVTSGGTTVTDWTANNITLQAGEQLHLRWNATAYARCLPFIADNGAYSLGRGGDLAMRTGNTETEGYDVSEQSGTYRIECDGQANGEEGVDERRIEVLVR